MSKKYLTDNINPSPTISDILGADAADIRGIFVKYDTNGALVQANKAGEVVVGAAVINTAENAKKGDEITVQIREIGPVRAGAAIKKGNEIAVNAQGKAAVATAGQFVVGIALEDAAVGQLFYIEFCKYQKAAAAGA